MMRKAIIAITFALIVTLYGVAASDFASRPQIYQTANATTLVNPYRFVVSGAQAVKEITSTACASGTSYTIDYPATVDSGDLLILVLGGEDNIGFGTPTGSWTESHDNEIDSSAGREAIFTKIADGTEDGGTFSISRTSSDQHIASIIRVADPNGTASTAWEKSTKYAGSGTSINANSLSPSWGTTDFWILTTVWVDDDEAVSSWPTNYSANGTSPACGLGSNWSVRIGISWRENSASSEDPAALTLQGSERVAGYTIGIKP